MSIKSTEDSYFYKQDRELIESRKTEEIENLKKKHLEQDANFCTACGGEMKDREMDGIKYKSCSSCSYVNITLESLDRLYKEHKFARFKFTLDKQKERNDLLRSIEKAG